MEVNVVEKECRYYVFSQESQFEGDLVEQFGIVCAGLNGEVIQMVDDISTENKDVKQLTELMNEQAAAPGHFMDIVEDFLIGD